MSKSKRIVLENHFHNTQKEEDVQGIMFDSNGDSQVFTIGEDRVFFRQCDEYIVVAYADDGDVYGYTNQYISFKTVERAEQFLKRAQAEGQCPHGWEGDEGW